MTSQHMFDNGSVVEVATRGTLPDMGHAFEIGPCLECQRTTVERLPTEELNQWKPTGSGPWF